MCEDLPALTALHYLQKDVADVVDHANAEEADSFRSLLSHLLASPKSRMSPGEKGDAGPPNPDHQHSVSAENVANAAERPFPVLMLRQVQEAVISEHDRANYWEEDYPSPEDVPPKKRTRSSSPLEEGVWTSTIESEDIAEESRIGDGAESPEVGLLSSSGLRQRTGPMLEPVPRSAGTPTRSGAPKRCHAMLLLDEDPLERLSAGNGSVDSSMEAKRKPLSADRFCQRTEVFEALLAFINSGAKQPEGSLLDLVDAEDGL